MLKTTILLGNLKEGASFAHHAISSRSPLPVLLSFLIETQEGSVCISATDLEVGIQVKIPAKIESAGSIAVSAKTFLDLVNSVDEDKIELEEKESGLWLTTKRIKTHFPTLPSTEFPKLYEEKGEKIAVFKKLVFEEAISKAVFAAAQDTTRPALSGVLIQQEGNEVSVVATDGYRLSLKKGITAKSAKDKEEGSLLVSARTIKEVIGAKGKEEDLALYTFPSGNQALFEVGDVTIVGRLIEAEYPDYQKIIPQDLTTKAEFDKADALSAVRSCSVFAREAANIIKVSVQKDKLVFSAAASSTGENEVEVEAKVTGEENEIAFNARYLLEFLSNIDSDRLTFEMTGPLNPGVFRIAGDNSFLHLIMPIRVQG